jgi:hypothetical protein
VLLRDELELRLGEEYVFLGVLLRVFDELLLEGLVLRVLLLVLEELVLLGVVYVFVGAELRVLEERLCEGVVLVRVVP